MIRKAAECELSVLTLMAKKFHGASNFASLGFDESNMEHIIRRAIRDAENREYILLVADVGDGVKTDAGYVSGAMLASIWEPPHSLQAVACDIAFVSLVSGRGVGELLIKEYLAICGEVQAKPMLGVNMGINNPAGYALLKKCGFAEIGKTFMHQE